MLRDVSLLVNLTVKNTQNWNRVKGSPVKQNKKRLIYLFTEEKNICIKPIPHCCLSQAINQTVFKQFGQIITTHAGHTNVIKYSATVTTCTNCTINHKEGYRDTVLGGVVHSNFLLHLTHSIPQKESNKPNITLSTGQ